MLFTPQIIDLNTNKLSQFKHIVSKVICVGRNYIEHAEELDNPVPSSPILFIKPNSSLTWLSPKIYLPEFPQPVQHELEVSLLIGSSLRNATLQEAERAIAGVGIGLDLTVRELQAELKQKGHPWEKAKAFDGSCPVSAFIASDKLATINQLEFSMVKNGEISQQGNTKDMIFSIQQLLVEASRYFSLLPGDIVMTGTPAGVAALKPGDQLTFYIDKQYFCEASVEQKSL